MQTAFTTIHSKEASIGLELINAAFSPLSQFISNVDVLLCRSFALNSTDILSCHHDRWTYLVSDDVKSTTSQAILGDEKRQFEETGLIIYADQQIPLWAFNSRSASEPIKHVALIRLLVQDSGKETETTNGALLIRSEQLITPHTIDQIISLGKCLGCALDLAIKYSCQNLTTEVTTRLFDSPDLNSWWHKVAVLVKSTLHAQAASIWLHDQATNLIKIGGTTGLKDPYLPVRQVSMLLTSDALPASFIRTKRELPMFIDDVQWLDKNWEESEMYLDNTTAVTKSVLYVPIVARPSRSQPRVLGVIRVTNRQATVEPTLKIISFTNQDVIWASHICDLLALIIHSTSTAHKLLRLYEMAMHGTKTALEAINDNLVSLAECESLKRSIPIDLRYAIPDSISFIDDLRWQVKRTELWQRAKLEWEPQRVLLGSKVLPKVKELAERMAPVHEVDKLTFRYDDISDVPPVAANANALLAVLRNLTENSLKYCRDRCCIISIKIKTDKDEQYVDLYIEDDGIGISDEDRPFIFWGGYRAEAAMRHHPKGAGIGLAWSQRVMADIGGSLALCPMDEETFGCKFLVKIPIWKG